MSITITRKSDGKQFTKDLQEIVSVIYPASEYSVTDGTNKPIAVTDERIAELAQELVEIYHSAEELRETNQLIGLFQNIFELAEPEYAKFLRRFASEVVADSIPRETVREFIQVQDEYIRLLGRSISDSAGFLSVHHWHYPQAQIDKGKELRAKIAERRAALDLDGRKKITTDTSK